MTVGRRARILRDAAVYGYATIWGLDMEGLMNVTHNVSHIVTVLACIPDTTSVTEVEIHSSYKDLWCVLLCLVVVPYYSVHFSHPGIFEGSPLLTRAVDL